LLTVLEGHSLNYLLESTYERTYRGNESCCGWDKAHRRFYNAPMLAQGLREAGIVPERWGSSYLFPWLNPVHREAAYEGLTDAADSASSVLPDNMSTFRPSEC